MSNDRLRKGLLSLATFTFIGLIPLKAVEGLPPCYIVLPDTNTSDLVDLTSICGSGDVESERETFENFDSEVLFESGLKELEAGNIESALILFDQAIEQEPNNSDYYATRGEVNRSLGNFDNSRTDYQNALRTSRESDDTLFADYYQTFLQNFDSD